jgi:hypothetical protein
MIRNARRRELRQNPAAININNISMEEERKFEMLGNLRKRLGKTKEEFQKILQLYSHLLENKNP